jgi:hypothetical protein
MAPAVARGGGPVAEVGGLLEHRNRVLVDAGLAQIRPVEEQAGVPRFEQDPAADLVLPRRLHQVVRIELPVDRRFRRQARGQALMIGVVVLHIDGGVDLVRRRRLPGHAGAGSDVLLVEHRRPIEVRSIQPRALGRILVVAGDGVGAAPRPALAEEPQRILLDRPAERTRDIPDPPDGIDAVQAAIADLVGQVVALQVVVGVVREQVGLEGVAAVLRNQIQLHAAKLALGAAAAQLDVDFVGVGGVDVKTAAGALGRVVPHPVLQQPLLALRAAVNDHPERLLALVAADVLEIRRDDDARRQGAVGGDALVGRQHVEHFAGQHPVLDDVVDVHRRRRAGDGDGLLDGSDLHVCVQSRGEGRGQLDPVALDRAESDQ